MLGYKIAPGDDYSHEEAARPLVRFASGQTFCLKLGSAEITVT
jgi:hypothetical protein